MNSSNSLAFGPAVMPVPVLVTTASSTRGLIPAVGVLREPRALYPHYAEALAGRRLHDDPALGAIHHRRAQPFEASHLGGNVVGLDVYVHAALVLDAISTTGSSVGVASMR